MVHLTFLDSFKPEHGGLVGDAAHNAGPKASGQPVCTGSGLERFTESDWQALHEQKAGSSHSPPGMAAMSQAKQLPAMRKRAWPLWASALSRKTSAGYRAPDAAGAGLPGNARGPLERRIGTGCAGGGWCMVTISASAGFFPVQT